MAKQRKTRERKQPAFSRQDLPEDLVFLSREQVADLTGLSYSNLSHMAQERMGLPYIKASEAKGATVRYRLSDVREFMASRLVAVKES